MKKLFLSMLAAVTLFASCSQEEIVSKTDGESLVSFTVTTPELGSRAIGDGTTATDLYFVVYDETLDQQVTNISSKDTKFADFTGKKATINLPLLNGHKYSLIFWAENAAGAYAINWDKKSINLKDASALVSNNEKYDAFYAYVAPFTVTGTKSSTIQLKRPFAQLNIGTTATDLAGVKTYYNTEFAKSSIVVTAPTAMDLTSGNVSGEKDLTYAAAEFISSEKMKTSYEYLSMNYLLVSSDKSLVDVDFSITDGTKTISKTFENIPVQRNYKTNIYGDLFTSATEWKVEVAPGFTEPEFGPAAQLAALFEQGGEMTLYTDVELNSYLTLGEGKNVTINLNGNTITGPVTGTEKKTSYLFYVNGGTLDIKGEGLVETQNAYYSIPVWVNKGTVNIYGGEFKNAGDGCDLIYASGTGIVNIYGGYFKATDKLGQEDGTLNTNTALNKQDAARETAKINVYGGSFYKFDPANNLSEGPNTKFVAEGYTSVQVGDNFVVVEGTPAATAEEFVTALNNGGVVTLVGDVTTAATASLKPGSTLDGGNNTLFVGGEFKDYYASSTLRFIQTSGAATIQNMTIDGNNAAYKFDGDNDGDIDNYGIRGIFLTNAGNVTIDNVTIKNVLYPINTGDMSSVAANAKLSVSNSTLAGWSSFDGFVSAKFENCKFEVSAFNAGESIYNQGIAPYVTTVFENCDFAKGYYFDMSKFAVGATLTFNNCTVDGVKLTSAMFEKVTSSVDPVASKLSSDKTLWFEEGTNCKIESVSVN